MVDRSVPRGLVLPAESLRHPPAAAARAASRFAATGRALPETIQPRTRQVDSLRAVRKCWSCWQAYPWPGNVRELQSAIKFAFVQATGEILAPHWLPANIQRSATHRRNPPSLARESRSGVLDIAQLVRELIDAEQSDIYRRVHTEVDQILLAEVLRQVQGNQVLASQRLGISRTTLRAKLGALDPDADTGTDAE